MQTPPCLTVRRAWARVALAAGALLLPTCAHAQIGLKNPLIAGTAGEVQAGARLTIRGELIGADGGLYDLRSGTVLLPADVTRLGADIDLGTAEATGTLAVARMPAHAGDVTSAAGSATLTLANSGVVAGAYGSGTAAPVLTVDAKGRVIAASTAALTPAFAGLTGKPTTLVGYGILDAQPLDADLSIVAANGYPATTYYYAAAGSSDDGPALNAFIAAAGARATIILTAGQTYTTKQPLELKAGQTLDLNGATIKRADQYTTTATSNVTSGTNSFTVADASGFAAKQFVSFGNSSSHAIVSYKIASIVGNTINCTSNFSQTFSSGVAVTRVILGIVTSYTFDLSTHAADVSVKNGTIDGNRANNTTLASWYHGQDLVLWGPRGQATDLLIQNSPSEGLFGGNVDLRVTRCRFVNTGGNGVHVSAWQHTIVDACRFENTNQLSATWPVHNDGAVTLSDMSDATNFGRITIKNSWFDGVRTGIGGVFDTHSSHVDVLDNWFFACTNGPMFMVAFDDSPSKVIFSRNHCFGSGTFTLNLTSGSATGKITETIIDANIFVDTDMSLGRGVAGVAITNNDFLQSTARQSINIVSGAAKIDISRNRIKHTATTGANSNAIAVGSALTATTINDNKIEMATGPSGVNAILFLTGVSPNTNAEVSGNRITMLGADNAITLGHGLVCTRNRILVAGGRAITCGGGGGTGNPTQVITENTVRGAGTPVHIFGGSFRIIVKRNHFVGSVVNSSAAEPTVVVSDNDTIL